MELNIVECIPQVWHNMKWYLKGHDSFLVILSMEGTGLSVPVMYICTYIPIPMYLSV